MISLEMFNEFGGEQSHINYGEQDFFPLTLHLPKSGYGIGK